MPFTHLQIQSAYSLMKSTIKIEPLVKQAAEMGFDSLALTDEEVMSGSVAFYQACIEHGIKPIMGLKLTIRTDSGDFKTLLFAENNQGYQNLMKLSSWVQTQSITPELDKVSKYTDGLIAIVITSDSPWADDIAKGELEALGSEIPQWQNAFSASDFYLSVQDFDLHQELPLHKFLKPWSEQNDVPVVAISDVRYIHKEDAEAFHCLRAIEEGSQLPDGTLDDHRYLKTGEEMERFFEDWWPEAVDATHRIKERCHVTIDLDQQLIPSYPTPEGKTADEFLKELCFDALDRHYLDNKKSAINRLNHELQVIQSMKFSDYFLIVWDFIAYARNKGIHAGPGRGSAAGSIVAFLLDITQVDPLEYDLLFERFLNPERINMPDIDIDFPDHRRDEVIQYVAEKYGRHHVAQICTFGTFGSRSVLRDLFKVLAIDESDATFILKQIPKTSNEPLIELVKQSNDLKDYIRNASYLKRLFQVATKLEGLPRHVSTHAAGVIISEQPLVQYTALMSGQGQAYLTQLAMGDLEKIGLLKVDFLGLRNLTFIEKIEQKIQRFEHQGFSASTIPFDDEVTFQLLQEGRTNGVFQLESQGMKNVLKRLKPTHFEDVVAVNALYRPGPMDYIPTYINRKHGKENVKYPHPDITPILQPTFGVLVYQEQIMQVAQTVAGYSLGQADLLRRAVSKKQAQVLEEQRIAFVRGCLQQGYTEEIADQLFDWIVKFSNYGFNRSHAVAYSIISYKLAFMKAHYPTYFLSELMNAQIGDKEKVSLYIREARDMNIPVFAPSINKSLIATKDENQSIRVGLLAIKGVGYQAAQLIIEERKNGYYRGLNDFCLRLVSKVISRSVIESLLLAGAFDEFDDNRAKLLASVDQALEQAELFKEFQDQPELFGSDFHMGDTLEVEPFPQLKKLSLEKEVLGTYLSEHPLSIHRQSFDEQGYSTLAQAAKVKRKQVKVAGVIESIKEIRTKRGESMAFVTLSDEAGELDGVLFPDVYRDVRPWVEEQLLVLLNGKMEERRDRTQLIINKAERFEESSKEPDPERLFVKVQIANEREAIERLKKLTQYFPGNTPIVIFRAEDRKTYQLDYGVKVSDEFMSKLNDLFGEESIALR